LRCGDLWRLGDRKLYEPGFPHRPRAAIELGPQARPSSRHAISRCIATLWDRVDVEPELGLGQRFGEQDETEIWGAVFLRYRGFPWDRAVVTSVALSTGFNYASAVSEEEVERARDGKGSRWMHFFSPEITFALPRSPQVELLFRFHHRSGVFGLVSDAWGGAQYGAIGLRVRF